MNSESILKIVYERYDGVTEAFPFADGNDFTNWTSNHFLVEESLYRLLSREDINEIKVVRWPRHARQTVEFLWNIDEGVVVSSPMLEVE